MGYAGFIPRAGPIPSKRAHNQIRMNRRHLCVWNLPSSAPAGGLKPSTSILRKVGFDLRKYLGGLVARVVERQAAGFAGEAIQTVADRLGDGAARWATSTTMARSRGPMTCLKNWATASR